MGSAFIHHLTCLCVMAMFLIFFLVENAPVNDKKDLLSELDLMKKLRPHPHVIKLMGCVTKTGKIAKILVILHRLFSQI